MDRSDANITGGKDGPKIIQINIHLSTVFLGDIDTTRKERGFNSRSEFLRHAAHDAVKHPAFPRNEWQQIAAIGHGLRFDDSELVSGDEIVEICVRN